MAKPKPFVPPKGGWGKPPSAKKLQRELEEMASEFHTPRTVAKLFKGMNRIKLDELTWIASTKRGRRLIGKALRRIYKKELKKVEAMVATVVEKSAARRTRVR